MWLAIEAMQVALIAVGMRARQLQAEAARVVMGVRVVAEAGWEMGVVEAGRMVVGLPVGGWVAVRAAWPCALCAAEKASCRVW